MMDNFKIAVVIPCYKVKEKIGQVLEGMPEYVDQVYCVDDKCPQLSGEFIESLSVSRVKVIYRERNGGVGAAVITGYEQALEDGMDVMVKVDGDGQMDLSIMRKFIDPIVQGQCDYTKGNRFYYPRHLRGMPTMLVIQKRRAY